MLKFALQVGVSPSKTPTKGVKGKDYDQPLASKKMQRVTYRRRLSYNTKSNKTRVIKTPGGKLSLLYIQKKASAPKCGDCGIALPGVIELVLVIDQIKALRPTGYMRVSRRQKTVQRAYGGSRCANCVKSR